MPFEATVESFAAALAEPSAPPPFETRGRRGAPDTRRFSVYRNNVAVGLIGAIEARFPICRRILGEAAFRALARAFVRAHQPRSPVIIAYGGEFPDFLASQDVARDLPFLADLAQLENAWVEAYHAADAAAATLADLATLAPEKLAKARAVFHPAARLLPFATPAASVWAAHQDGAEPAAPSPTRAEDVLVSRPESEVLVRKLPPGGYAFAACLSNGATFAEAAAALADPEDFGAHLVGLVEAGAISSITPGEAT